MTNQAFIEKIKSADCYDQLECIIAEINQYPDGYLDLEVMRVWLDFRDAEFQNRTYH